VSRISATFKALSEVGEGAYIPYVCAGDPTPEFSARLVSGLCSYGADMIELGLPFSDPVADGPTIQSAMTRALKGGFRTSQLFSMISTLREDGVKKPIIVMTYANPVLRMGIESFCSTLTEVGGDGLLVVDMPPEESSSVDSSAASNNLDVIRLVAPTTDDARLDILLPKASGYVYAVSVSGVTGARDRVSADGLSLVKRVSSKSRIPVVLGFGVSRPEHARAALESGASGVVEGSRLISMYSNSTGEVASSFEKVLEHCREMKAATRPR